MRVLLWFGPKHLEGAKTLRAKPKSNRLENKKPQVLKTDGFLRPADLTIMQVGSDRGPH